MEDSNMEGKTAIGQRLIVMFGALMLLNGCCHNIELVSPVDRAELSLLRVDWKERIAERSKRPRVSETKWGLNDRLDRPAAAFFSWKGDGGETYILDISRDKTFSAPVKTLTVKGMTAEISDLEVGRTYFWRIRSGKLVSPVRTFTTDGDTPRFLNVPGGIPANFRDAGGKKTRDGRRTRQGMIFRGSEMNKTPFVMKPEGLRFMRDELKIRCDLDLRYPNVTEKFKSSPLGDDVRWIRRPVNAYKSFTPEQNELFRDTIRVFTDPDNYPVYVHCTAGVDRTGEIIFLLDMLLNVDEERAFLDYEASSLTYYPRPRTIAYFAKWLKTIAGMSPEGTPRSQQVVNYLKNIGVTEEEIASIRRIMLE